RELADLELIAVGAYSPLQGFMGRADYEEVIHSMHLANGLPWSLPITLSTTKEEAASLQIGEEVALMDGDGQWWGLLALEEKYTYSKELEATLVYRTKDVAHPGVAWLMSQGEVLPSGPITLLQRRQFSGMTKYNLDPATSRQAFLEKGWRSVVGFQTRNPVHRAHEYIQKCALEMVDGLFLHPLVGDTKADDVPAGVRMNCYEALLKEYYPKSRVVLGVLPAAMRYAGPREAVFHALVRKNYGCTHFIVGRDHAGVGNYYGSYDAHHIFDEFSRWELGITPMFFENAFYCQRCGSMATTKTCPHEENCWVTFTGTVIRYMLRDGEQPPAEFTRPEVAQVLMAAYKEGGK
ncbi:MAG: sulfate adenylyltransferase, partial [Chloroflexota bacterium]